MVDGNNLHCGIGSIQSTIRSTCGGILVYVHRKTDHEIGCIVYGNRAGIRRRSGNFRQYAGTIAERHTTYVPFCRIVGSLYVVHNRIEHRPRIAPAETNGLFRHTHIYVCVLRGDLEVLINGCIGVRRCSALLRHTKAAADTDTRTEPRFICAEFGFLDLLKKRRRGDVQLVVVKRKNIFNKYFLNVE